MYKRNGKFADYLFDRMDIDLPEDIQKSKVNEPAEVKPNNQNSTSNKYKNIQPLTVSNSEFEILSNKSRNENFKIVSELPATFQNNSTQVKSLQKMFEQSKLRLNFKDNKCYMWNNINNVNRFKLFNTIINFIYNYFRLFLVTTPPPTTIIKILTLV